MSITSLPFCKKGLLFKYFNVTTFISCWFNSSPPTFFQFFIDVGSVKILLLVYFKVKKYIIKNMDKKILWFCHSSSLRRISTRRIYFLHFDWLEKLILQRNISLRRKVEMISIFSPQNMANYVVVHSVVT